MRSHLRIAAAIFLFSGLLLLPALAAAGASTPAQDGSTQQCLGWTRGHTSLSDLTPEQKRARLGWRKDPGVDFLPRFTPRDRKGKALPKLLDWRSNTCNYITDIRDQGQCGACYAFSAVGAVEANIAIKHNMCNPTIDLSEQFIVSCESAMGCNGGYISQALDSVREPGVPDEGCFPYFDSGPACSGRCADWAKRTISISDYQVVLNAPAVTSAQIQTIIEALQVGPVTVAFDVYDDFFDYTGGVYYPEGIYQGGHAVVIVGYDTDLQCWICKNSWGDGWGEEGFFRIAWGVCNMGYETLLPIPSECTGKQLQVKGVNLGDGFLRYDESSYRTTFRVLDDCGRSQPDATVSATYNGRPLDLYDDGQHGDGAANDGYYSNMVPASYVSWGAATIAVDAAKSGYGPASLSVSGTVKQPANVLLVADDGNYSGVDFYAKALEAHGIPFDVYRVLDQHLTAPVDLLPKAPSVIWFTGPGLGSFAPDVITAVTAYFNRGGNMLVSGQDILDSLYDYIDPKFCETYFHVAKYWNDANYPAVSGVKGEPLTEGLGGTLNFPFENFSDIVKPAADAKAIWVEGANKAVGVRYPVDGQAGPYKMIFTAFPVETLSAQDAASFLRNVYQWWFPGAPTDDDDDNDASPADDDNDATDDDASPADDDNDVADDDASPVTSVSSGPSGCGC
jgi:C1A family cysteine protease